MPAFLRPHVHAVSVGEDLVLLDVDGDRYLCLPGAGPRLSADRRSLSVRDAAEADELAGAGLTGPAPEGPRPELPPPRPLRDLNAPAPGPLGWGGGLEAARGGLEVLLTYRRRSFGELVRLARAGRRGPPRDGPPSREMAEVVRRFHRWAPWTPASAKCLLRSHLLLRCLRRRGHDARWVFAVRTWPFAAHCWLQAGDVALDDDWERLSAFHPILAV